MVTSYREFLLLDHPTLIMSGDNLAGKIGQVLGGRLGPQPLLDDLITRHEALELSFQFSVLTFQKLQMLF
jgi:hypothetical protein